MPKLTTKQAARVLDGLKARFGWTQSEVARRLGISATSVSAWRRNGCSPMAAKALKCLWLEKAVDDLAAAIKPPWQD